MSNLDRSRENLKNVLSTTIIQALAFATKAHLGQKRKYTGEDYINHPIDVADTLRLFYPQATEEMYCAALLHDVVEDCDVTIDDVNEKFGLLIAGYVDGLTDVSKPEDGNRKKRKAIDRDHIKRGCFEVQVIKCADMISNSLSITKHDPEFAKTYMAEKRALLECMRDETKSTKIYSYAMALVYKYEGNEGWMKK